jgi:hypothetical protein
MKHFFCPNPCLYQCVDQYRAARFNCNNYLLHVRTGTMILLITFCFQNMLVNPFCWISFLAHLYEPSVHYLPTKASCKISIVRSPDSPAMTHTHTHEKKMLWNSVYSKYCLVRLYFISWRTTVSAISRWHATTIFVDSDYKGNTGNIQSLQ